MAGITWDWFQRTLDHEVDWDAPSPRGLTTITEALQAMWRAPNVLTDYIARLSRDNDRFNQYEPHQEYPRQFMDKFVIYMDPADRYRVRLHRWAQQREYGNRVQEAHDHRWWFTSIILKGAYVETIYAPTVDAEAGTAVLTPVSNKRYDEGQGHSLPPQVPHSIYNANDDVECLTLFVRGKSLYDVNTTYLDDGTYVVRRGRGKQIRDELDRLSKLINPG